MRPTYSRRAAWAEPPNRLGTLLEARRREGREILDLTVSNPTRVGLELPWDELAEALARGARAAYAPDPLGLRTAREALAEHLGAREGAEVAPDDLVLTASSSEAYGFLFRIFGDPGDEVVTPAPAYPLLDQLAALESLRLRRFPLERSGRWSLDPARLEEVLGERSRVVVVVHPNNPTGSFLRASEADAAARISAARGLPLVSDEVFADFPLVDDPARAPSLARRDDVVAIALGGLSKSAGFPQLKLGWIRLGGPAAERARLRAALEVVGDAFLSVATPVQQALPAILPLLPRIQAAIRGRLAANLARIRAALPGERGVTALPVEGGWSVVLELPRVASDEAMALDLLTAADVLVHPGYLFDFEAEGHLVLSLLAPEATLAEGLERLGARVETWLEGSPPA